MTGAQLHSTPEHLVSGLYEGNIFTPYLQTTISLLLSTVHLTALDWKSFNLPTVKAWQDKLWEFYVVAKFNYNLLLHSSFVHCNKLQNIWTPSWITYLTTE